MHTCIHSTTYFDKNLGINCASSDGILNHELFFKWWHFESWTVLQVMVFCIMNCASSNGILNHELCFKWWHFESSTVLQVMEFWIMNCASSDGVLNHQLCFKWWHFESYGSFNIVCTALFQDLYKPCICTLCNPHMWWEEREGDYWYDMMLVFAHMLFRNIRKWL